MKRISVTLRSKAISKGRQTLYLDFFPPILNPETGKYTRREFLKLYLYDKPKSYTEKVKNSEHQRTAELICTRRQNEVNKEFIYTPFELEQLRIKAIGQQSFLDYFKKQGDKRTGSNWDIWDTAIRHFEAFLRGKDILFQDLTISFVDDYRDYLLTAKNRRNGDKTIARNTALSYFNKLKATLKKAYKEGLLQRDINSGIEGINEQESQRNYLTLEEAAMLFKTPCKKEIVKRVSLFAIFTGIRYSDIAKLKWKDVQHTLNDGYYIRFTQKKTEKQETMPISENAFEILGEPRNPEEKIFPGLKKWDFDRVVPLWVAAAGIKKHITFHCFRHTYATLQIAGGTNLLTVSKMLGHKSIKTTQIYAKVIDETKREATKKIKFW
ncbi:site-specific integrase [Flavobacterium sp. DG1-102-2]|uniref:tyrosine-type recombinase/integrase n=1 Tax=Flavobacterium sp. DG1-102-2 TaxID=3081663 RepID=UPI002949E722|nr:site-specific integrase [Flavobacterium sp. DG1-102-2]MDV6167103.1 site-specific integrase [Flavobacterium sp. DG1-102-2]